MKPNRPLRIAIVNDYEVVVAGLARMLLPYSDRVEVVELAAGERVRADVDVALYDTFAQGQGREVSGDRVVERPGRQKVVVFAWGPPDRRQTGGSYGAGIDAYLTKEMSALDLVGALESIHAGTWQETSQGPGEQPGAADDTAQRRAYGDWPGREHGLSERESEVISLIVQGLSNDQVADRAFLSINTVKSYIRTSYRKMGVTTRSQAVLWGVDHGFKPDRVRLRTRDDDAL